MSQRRGLGKGLGALIPQGGVRVAAPPRHPRPTAEDAATATKQKDDPETPEVVDVTEGRDRPATTEPDRAPTDPQVRESERLVGSVTGGSDLTQEAAAPHAAGDRDAAGDEVVIESEDVIEAVATTRPDASPGPGAVGVTTGETTHAGSDAATSEFGLVYAELTIELISPNPQQPRREFDEDSLSELAHSISEIGLLQPVVVRAVSDDSQRESHEPVGDRYELVAGERRLRAARLAGLDRIPALIRQTDDEAMLRDALLENLHRVQLNPLEEAAAYSQLLSDFACTQEELAGRIGRSRPQISNTLRLLRLPPKVQRRVAAGVLSSGHARALLSFEDADRMAEIGERIIAEGLSVRAVEELAVLEGTPNTPRPRRRKRQTPVEYREAADKLGDFLETRVRIETGARRGRIVVEFGDVDDLGRILDLIQDEEPTI